MSSIIDTTYSQRIQLPSFNEDDAKNIKKKGWSFSYVYSFSEIKDVYLVLKKHAFTNLIEFTKYCIEIKLPAVKTKWNDRRILEHLNALKNFEIIDANYKIQQDVFSKSEIGIGLTEEDLTVFKRIYFSYFRFKEIFLWFVDPQANDRESYINALTEQEIIHRSKALFCFSEKSRFTDTFSFELKDNPLLFFIDLDSGEDLMRFWDVFIKWGLVLGTLEKFNLRNLDIKTIKGKGIACVYVLKEMDHEFDLFSYIKDKYVDTYIYLPTLVLDMAITLRQKIEDIHKIIIEQYKLHKENFSFERTSEIFVKKGDIKPGDKIFFPKYNDAYVSHLIIRK